MGSGIYSLGTTALLANQAMMDTTSHNIANVNTPGYSRQSVELGTQDGLFTGAGFYGRGVKVQTITRTTNEFLIKESNLYTAQHAADSSRLDKLQQLETVLPTGEAGLGFAANQVLNAFSDVVNQPQDTSARQVVLSRAQEFVSRIQAASSQLTELQTGIVSDVGVTVDRINRLTDQIGKVNDSIARFQGSGHTPNDLLDKRDELVRQLNEQVQVTTVAAEDGTLNVFMSGGQLLVLGNQVQRLAAVRDTNDPALARVALETNGSFRVLNDDQMTGGALKGLLEFQDEDLASVSDQLDSFTASFANAVNAQQQLGLNIASPGGVPPPLFANTASASTITLFTTAPGDIAAASPLTASAPNSNSGTVSVTSLTMVSPYASSGVAAQLPVQVVFDSANANGSVNYHFVDRNGLPYKDTSPSRVWNDPSDTSTRVISDADPANPGTPALFNIALTGMPKPGDVLNVSLTQFPDANNGNAMAMLNLRDLNVVSIDGGTTVSTATNSYSQMIGNLGVLVQSGETAADISTTLKTNAEQTLSSTSGVNLDEEAARLIQYQQAYQASAKVLQIAQSLFDTLLRVAGG
jgi:flagellar hook-associated protein 1